MREVIALGSRDDPRVRTWRVPGRARRWRRVRRVFAALLLAQLATWLLRGRSELYAEMPRVVAADRREYLAWKREHPETIVYVPDLEHYIPPGVSEIEFERQLSRYHALLDWARDSRSDNFALARDASDAWWSGSSSRAPDTGAWACYPL